MHRDEESVKEHKGYDNGGDLVLKEKYTHENWITVPSKPCSSAIEDDHCHLN